MAKESNHHLRYLRTTLTTSIAAKRRRRETDGEDESDDRTERVWISPEEDDAFSGSFSRFWGWRDKRICPRRRPLPSSHVLASSVHADSRKPIPLIQDFLRSVGKTEAPGDNDDAGPAQQADSQDHIQDGIDDSGSSTLTPGQHRRFRQLLTERETGVSWKDKTRKEYRSLRKMVEAEQRRYLEALHRFWEKERKETLTAGFRAGSSGIAAAFAQIAACPEFVKKNCWKKSFSPKVYGPCRQVISIPSLQSLSDSHDRSLSVDSIVSEVIRHVDRGNNANGSMKLHDFPPEGSRIPVPSRASNTPLFGWSARFLREDAIAMELASKHKADIVTTAETLQAMLQDIEHAEWVLPVHYFEDIKAVGGAGVVGGGIAVVDLPLPRPYDSPRQCLTAGFQEGILQWLLAQHTNGDGSSDKCIYTLPEQYMYTLLTLPVSPAKVCRVLVRSRAPIFRYGQEQPVTIRVHLEYFHGRGPEIPSSCEKAVWVLDHLLLPGGRVVVARADPSSGSVRAWEDVGIAHAIVEDSIGVVVKDHPLSRHKDPVHHHWRAMIRILQAIRTIGRGHHVLCLPARQGAAPFVRGRSGVTTSNSRSISVHSQQDGAVDGKLCLDDDLDRAGEVPLGLGALQRCFCHWEWSNNNNDRVPYTFPLPASRQQPKTSTEE